MARVKYVMLFPLTYNNGRAVEEELLDQFLDRLFVLGDGFHIAGEGRGAYRMKSGSRQIDRSLEIWAAIEEANESGLKRLLAEYGKLLGQESMYLERTSGIVEFVAPADEEATP